MTDDIEQQLRHHLQRKLALVHGAGQITVRRLVKCLYYKNGQGFRYAEEPSLKGRHHLYSLAAEICEEAGGTVALHGYCRCKQGRGKSVASRVYQF